MTLLFFHGGEILGFFAGVVAGFAVWAAILSLLFIRPPRNPVVPAVIYFVVASLPGMLFLFSTDLNMLQLILVWMAIFPWSLIFVLLAAFFDLDIGNSAALVGALLNAVLFYVIGRTARWRMDLKIRKA